MNLQELKAAAKAAEPAYMRRENGGSINGDDTRMYLYGRLANPATILKLIAVVEAAQGVIVCGCLDCRMLLNDTLEELEK